MMNLWDIWKACYFRKYILNPLTLSQDRITWLICCTSTQHWVSLLSCLSYSMAINSPHTVYYVRDLFRSSASCPCCCFRTLRCCYVADHIWSSAPFRGCIWNAPHVFTGSVLVFLAPCLPLLKNVCVSGFKPGHTCYLFIIHAATVIATLNVLFRSN